ncbi:MAG TPA: hypothetical protein PLT92_11295 [Ignavibacteriaceae bacterium]|nr:hypothetical protein [Ignavibacteriaceae bacterium]HOJ19134.1 hypothetical protein [Ignavibacteriaceae bacterium]
MFRVLSISGVMVLFLFSHIIYGQSTKRYEFKSMIIDYETESSVMGTKTKGTKTVWIDQFGEKEASYTKATTTMSLLGMNSTEEKEDLSIIDGKTAYTINLIEKTGFKSDITEMQNMANAFALNYQRNGKKYKNLREFVEDNKGEWIGEETFLGKKCEVFVLMEVKMWMYKNVVLKSEGQMKGMDITETAKSIQEGVSIPKDKFKVPAGITLTDMPKGFDMETDEE